MSPDLWDGNLDTGNFVPYQHCGDYPSVPAHPVYKFALTEKVKEDKRFLPTRGEPTATGWDVRCALKDEEIEVWPFEMLKIPLGFRVFCPAGWWLELRPRSSSFVKRNLDCLYGVIDEGFEAECMFVCKYIPQGGSMETLIISFGDALGQLLPVRRQEMNVVEITNEEYDRLAAERGGVRGTGGFGSTEGKI